MKIDCKKFYEEIVEEVKEKINNENLESSYLRVIIVGADPTAVAYTNGKSKDFEKIGCRLDVTLVDSNKQGWINQLITAINDNNMDAYCAGIIVEFDKNIDIDPNFKQAILNRINPNKDIDGLGKDSVFYPCTAQGAISLILDFLDEKVEGKTVCVLGRSQLVGKPLVNMLIEEGATVISCNSKTTDEQRHIMIHNADVIISAVGKPGLVKRHHLGKEQIVLDIGTTYVDGKLVGDIDSTTYAEDNLNCPRWYTTVPGGMGLVTRAMVLKHFAIAAKKQKENRTRSVDFNKKVVNNTSKMYFEFDNNTNN